MRHLHNIQDERQEGFVNGILYVLRYYETVVGGHLTDKDISRLCRHLECNKSCMSSGEWEDLIHSYAHRWRKE